MKCVVEKISSIRMRCQSGPDTFITFFWPFQYIDQLHHENLQEAYGQIPKVFYDSKSPYFQTGFKTYEPLPEWKSTGMKQVEAGHQARNDARIFKPVFYGTLFLNFLIALLWMPHWAIEDINFLEDSPSAMIGLLNIFLLFFSRTYWRKNQAWYRPLLDITLLIAVQLSGMAASTLLYPPIPETYFEAVIIDGFVLGCFLFAVFVGSRLAFRSPAS
ncbi:hypothetical protein EDM52_16335 [Brevibacillus invocatus]|uniref:Uncharacterized protein n=3 Tax=Brevibacillus TaxID=55080 RepID=A0A3M8C694_9BACL|nr:hypothetical protein EDM52_16335 [Brevibacillus invocatus]